MELSKFQRLTLINQYHIRMELDLIRNEGQNEKDFQQCIDILTYNYQSLFHTLDECMIFGAEPVSQKDGKNIQKILNIYTIIENLIKRDSKYKILRELPFGHFRGFDGNHESHLMQYVRFLINDLNNYELIKPYYNITDGFNSHCPTFENYKNIISKYDMEINLTPDIHSFTIEQWTDILTIQN